MKNARKYTAFVQISKGSSSVLIAHEADFLNFMFMCLKRKEDKLGPHVNYSVDSHTVHNAYQSLSFFMFKIAGGGFRR